MQESSFILIEFIILVVFVGYMLSLYTSKLVNFYVIPFVYLCIVLAFSILITLPLDVLCALNELNNNQFNTQQNNDLQKNWHFYYWSCFMFSWFILPFFQEFEESGQFTFQAKCRESFRNNAIFIGSVSIFGIIFVVYLAIQGQFDQVGFLPFVGACSNCFGISLIIFTMGYGLVAVPRTLWRKRSQETNLKLLQYMAVQIDENRQHADLELEDSIKICLVLLEKNIAFQTELEIILNQVPKKLIQQAKNQMTTAIVTKTLQDFGDISLNKIIQLNKKVKQSILEVSRAQAKWNEHLEQAFITEDIVHCSDSMDMKIVSIFWRERKGFFGNLLQKLIWLWHVKIKGFLCRILAFIFGLLSIMVCFWEVTLFAENQTFLRQIINLKIGNQTSLIITQITTLIPLIYMTVCVSFGLFNMKISGLYGLYMNNQTDASSLIFASMQFLKISPALCYNFLSILKIHNAPFEMVMGNINVVPLLGNDYMQIFPLLLILLCLTNIFDIFSKFLGFIGLKQFQFSDKFNDENIDEGKLILQNARKTRERLIRTSISLDAQSISNYQKFMLFTENDENTSDFRINLSKKPLEY